MKLYQYFFSILFISILCADNQTAEDILLKTLHRMDGIDYQLKLDSKSSGKKKKEYHFQASVHWPAEGKFLCQTRLTAIETKRKKPSSFWENRFRDGTKTKRWLSRPVTGKLKDVSDKKVSKKIFSFSELRVTEAEIRFQTHQLLPQDNIEEFSAYVIKSIKKNNKGDIKESKKLWIEAHSHMILKVEYYTGSGRLYRRVECSNLLYIKEIIFPMSIYVQDLKSKTDIQITLKEIELNPEFDMNIFIPQDQ